MPLFFLKIFKCGFCWKCMRWKKKQNCRLFCGITFEFSVKLNWNFNQVENKNEFLDFFCYGLNKTKKVNTLPSHWRNNCFLKFFSIANTCITKAQLWIMYKICPYFFVKISDAGLPKIWQIKKKIRNTVLS